MRGRDVQALCACEGPKCRSFIVNISPLFRDPDFDNCRNSGVDVFASMPHSGGQTSSCNRPPVGTLQSNVQSHNVSDIFEHTDQGSASGSSRHLR